MNDWCMNMKRSKWKMTEQASFLLKLGELLEYGYSLSDGIQFLKFQETKKKRLDLDEAVEELMRGYPFYAVLTALKFHPQLISFIYYAEQYGDLSRALKEAGTYWEKRSSDMEKIQKLLVYPVLLLLFVGGAFYMLQGVLLPQFEVLFSSMDAKENGFLAFVRLASSFLSYLPYLLGAAVILGVLLRQFWYMKLSPLKRRLLLLKIPILGPFIKLYETQFFASQFSSLLSGGLSLKESILLFSENQQQPFYKNLCLIIKNELTEGKPLEDILKAMPYFDKNFSIVAANGLKYGRLDQELFHYSRYLLEKIEERMTLAMRIVQPALFSFVGILVISIYLAVLLPMFSLMKDI